jgi:hypothetical protein
MENEWSDGDDAEQARALKRAAICIVGEEQADAKADDLRAEYKAMQAAEDAPRRTRAPRERIDPFVMAQHNLRQLALLTGGDPDAIPTTDQILNRGRGIEAKEARDPEMRSRSGWLLPDGTYYGCASFEHIGLAEAILDPHGKRPNLNHEWEAGELGWCKISKGMHGLSITCPQRITQRQLDRLWDYATKHGLDFEAITQSLRMP